MSFVIEQIQKVSIYPAEEYIVTRAICLISSNEFKKKKVVFFFFAKLCA